MRVFVEKISNIFVSIYTVGYSEQGESLVIILKECLQNEAWKILHTTVIDCYESKSSNKTIEILDQNSISTIDLLCWSHPHTDHSEGMIDIFNKYCTKNTDIILPHGILGSCPLEIDISESEKLLLSTLQKSNTHKNYNINSVSVIKEFPQIVTRNFYSEQFTNLQLELNIKAVSPQASIVDRNLLKDSITNKNIFSIALVYEIGELRFLFSSDIENQSLRLVGKEILENIYFLKTPHHTSISSDILLDIINPSSKIPIACTTVNAKNDLPNDELVEKYKQQTDFFFSTGLKKDNDNDYGIVELQFLVVEQLFPNSSLQGNALQL